MVATGDLLERCMYKRSCTCGPWSSGADVESKDIQCAYLGRSACSILHYRGSTLLVRHMRNYQHITLWQIQSAAAGESLPRRRLNMESAAQQPLDSPEPLSSAQGRSWAALETPSAPAAASPAMLRARAALITGNEDVRPKDAPMSLGCCRSRI